jgi:hypothetical protein
MIDLSQDFEDPLFTIFPPKLLEKCIIPENQINRTKPIHTFACGEPGMAIEYIIEDDGGIIIVGEKSE